MVDAIKWILLTLGAGLAWYGLSRTPTPAPWEIILKWGFAWATLGFGIQALLYGLFFAGYTQVGYLMKNPKSGTLRFYSPLLAFNQGIDHLVLRLYHATTSANTIDALDASELFISGRLLPKHQSDFEKNQLSAVLDLCAEYQEVGFIRSNPQIAYLNIPLLDRTWPSSQQLTEGVEWILEQRKQGRRVLVHCAKGKQRSALFCLASLLAAHRFDSPEAAIQACRKVRPVIRPTFGQRTLLTRWWETRSPQTANP